MKNKRLLSPKEAAAELGISVKTIHRWDEAGKLHTHRTAGNQRRVPVEEVSRQANQLRGKINQYTKAKAYEQGIVTVEVNPWGTSQHCSRCGAKGERFSLVAGNRVKWKGGKLFWCPVCHYCANADYNGSTNLHHSFFAEYCWQPKHKRTSPG